MNTGLASSNRLGKHRLLPDTAEESDPAGLTAGPLPAQAGRSGAAVPQAGLLPGPAGQAETSDRVSAVISAEHTASRGLPGTITNSQVVAGGGDSHPLDGGVVHQSLVDSDQDQTQEIMSDGSAETEAQKLLQSLQQPRQLGGGSQ